MNFHALAIATSVIALLLAVGWLLGGRLLLRRWGIEPTQVGLLMGRRIGALYLGLSTIFFLARNTPPSELRSVLSVGAIVVCSVLAGLGVLEFRARRAGPAILVSVVVEILLVVGFADLEWTTIMGH